MILFQNCGVLASFSFYLITKFFSVIFVYYNPMYNKRITTLTSIPEKCESIEEVRKWVPKKKHEVLKAKYKCLKKLFQIYDASVIGILPEPCLQDVVSVEESETEVKKTKRKKRSNRTKTDACAGTTEICDSDIAVQSASEKGSTIATAVMRDLKMTPCSCTSTQFDSTYTTAKVSREKITCERQCECNQIPTQPLTFTMPYHIVTQKPKLTRFQIFIQRIFGFRRDYKNLSRNGRIYAASDNNIVHHYGEKRRRRGLRFRRLRRPKKVQSDTGLRSVKSPTILTYVQSVQRNCLMDTTPRQCPIVGCRMISYGIINYNDHLNLCHFTDRKFICHYCHEGFEKDYDKYVHENDHIGITKLSRTSTSWLDRQSVKKASDTQTDPELTKVNVPEEKLKKIVSFFDKITDGDMIAQMKKDRLSEANLRTHSSNLDNTTDNVTVTNNSSYGDKRTVSCVHLHRKNDNMNFSSSGESDVTSKYPFTAVTCNFCGEQFDFRRQLSLHMDLEHRVHDKYSKFHSCAGIINSKRYDIVSQDGKKETKKNNLRSINTCSTLTQDSDTSRESDVTLSCDPSTNIVYYTSLEAVKPSSEFVNKGGYKWEPGTNIIRV